jgi:hypothetical protein
MSDQRRFRIFSSRTFLGSNPAAPRTHPFVAFSGDSLPYVPLLVPFWGQNDTREGEPSSGRYARFAQVGRSFLSLTSIGECEAAVFPQTWESTIGSPERLARARAFGQLARDAGKPTVVFFWSDRDDPVSLEAVVFRTSLYRSRRRQNEFAQPAWSEDFLARYLGGEFRVRPKLTVPTVGFCGFAPPDPPAPRGLRGRVRRSAGDRKRALQRRFHMLSPGHEPRRQALRALATSAGLHTNFIVRGEFMGGAIPHGQPDVRELRRVRQEYVANMVASDYVLCVRGAGNFSYRLYETLSCGRIPVFVDTDCVLPLDFAVDWREYCVWIDQTEIGQIGDRVAEFHEGLSDTDFADLQRECRRFWETHISPEGFFSHLHRHFR